MPIRVQCANPDCRASFSVSDADLGRSGRCKKCGWKFPISSAPGPDGPSSPGEGPDGGPPEEGLASGSTFGRYRIVRLLGRGGMGAVYLAQDTQLDRRVALKVPRFAPGDSPKALDRFYREAKAAATFNHPNLCPVYDVGQVDGVHYLTMPYIQGQPLSEVIDPAKPLPQRQVAAVVRKLALALQEAHRRGVIHRDLKPANIMANRRRELVVLDFGLARRDEGDDARLTSDGAVLGTPSYMAPEQVAGDLASMGPGCDIYSLGVIMYELLAGRRPFEGPASLVLGLIAIAEPSPPSAHRPGLDPRLEAICLKAMAKEVGDRYASMNELAAALGAYLGGESRQPEPASSPPVEDTIATSAPSSAEKALVGHFFAQLDLDEESPRRQPQSLETAAGLHPAPPRRRQPPRRAWVAAASAGAMLLLGAAVYRIATDKGELIIETADPDVEVVVTRGGERVTIVDPRTRSQVELRSGEYHVELQGNPEGLRLSTDTLTLKRGENTIVTVRRGDGPGRRAGPDPRKGDVEKAPDPALTHDEPQTAAKAPDPVPTQDEPQEAGAVVASQEFAAEGHPAVPGKEAPTEPPAVATPATPTPGEAVARPGPAAIVAGTPRRLAENAGMVTAAAFLPDGRSAVSVGGERLILWDVVAGREIRRFAGHPDTIWSVAVSPDGRYAVTGGQDYVKQDDWGIRMWDLASGKLVRVFTGHGATISGLAFTPNGRHVVSTSWDKTLRVWDVATGALVTMAVRDVAPLSIAVAPDGHRVLLGSVDRDVILWELNAGEELGRFSGHTDRVEAVAMTPDGRRAISASHDHTIRVWDVRTGRPTWTLRGHTGQVAAVACSPDGRHLASGGFDRTIRLWDLRTGQQVGLLDGGQEKVRGVAFAPDGRTLLTGGFDGTLLLWRLTLPSGAEKAAAPSRRGAEGRPAVLVDADTKGYRSWLDRMRVAGYRPTFVNAHDAAGGPRFAAIAIKTAEKPAWEAYLDPSDETQQARFDDMGKRARPIGEGCFALDGSTAHATLWDTSAGGGDFFAFGFRNSQEYENKLGEMRAVKMRPASAIAYPAVASCRLGFIFRPDDGIPCKAWPDLTAMQLQAVLDEWRPQGYRPTSAAAYPDEGTIRFALVMDRDQPSRDWAERHGLTTAQLRKELDARKSKGYQPIVISGFREGGESRYLAIWLKSP